MQITKYEHACLVLEQNDKTLIIDPGIFTSSLPELDNVEAVVVTHAHPDHIDPAKIQAIANTNPNASLITVHDAASQHSGFNWQVVTGGSKASTSNFKLEFSGGKHAVIHESYPTTDNVGVLVNSELYYPGDSFTDPGCQVKLLAMPAAAPWLKISESIDYIRGIKPKMLFPTHNEILSDSGHTIYNGQLERAANAVGATLQVLKPGESIQV